MNRAAFFREIRTSLFGGRLTQAQVEGLSVILDAWESGYRSQVSIPQLGYCFGTDYHETAATMQPIKERGGAAYFTKLYDVTGRDPARARKMGNTKPGDGARYCGRGFVQLTWKINYEKAGRKIGVDLVGSPDLAMDPAVAAKIMFAGMEEGWFTGFTLDRAIDDQINGDEFADFLVARKIINGTDDARAIAEHSLKFLKALRAAA